MQTAESMNPSHKKRRVYFFFILLLLLVYFLAGVYPIQFKDISREQVNNSEQANNGAILTIEKGMQIRSPGIAYTVEAPPWLPLAIAIYDLEIILEVRTRDLEQGGPARIFTNSDAHTRNFTVAQKGGDLIVRMRHYYTSLNGTPNYVIEDVFTNTEWHHIRIRISSKTLEVHVDGNTVFTAPLPYQHLESWDSSYRLALGNELTGDRPWLGDIRKAIVRVGEKSFDYLAPDALDVPHTYTVVKSSDVKTKDVKDRVVILVPFLRDQDDRVSLVDWEINFINFIPFGWLLVLARSPRPGVLFATVLTACVSATIEIAQLLVTVDRFPSTEDFVLNTLGGAVGAWIAQHYVISIRRRPVYTGRSDTG